MTEQVHDFSHFVVQTLVSESWRSFDRYTLEDEALDIARQLIPDWGSRRVRVLGGYFDPEKARDVYHRVTITEAVPVGFLQALKSSKFALGGAGISGALLAVVLGLSAISTSFSTDAGANTAPEATRAALEKPADIPAVAAALAPVSLQQRFTDVAVVPYGKVEEQAMAPIRLRGPWSGACGTDLGTLVIDAQSLGLGQDRTHSASLTSVWQAGQRYGLLLEDGSVFVLDMVSFDQLKPVGTLSQTGEFSADKTGLTLNRCT